MQIPASTFALVAFVIAFVPGFVFAVIRISLRGFRADDKKIDARIAQSLVVSVLFDALYLLVAYDAAPPLFELKTTSIRVLDAPALGATVLLGGVIVPSIVAACIYLPWRLERFAKARNTEAAEQETAKTRYGLRLRRKWRFSSVPTAWDWCASDPTNRFVRILLPDKRYVAGFYGQGSYVSTYPEPRDIFISNPFLVSDSGIIGEEIKGSLGMWLTIPDGAIVDFVDSDFTNPIEDK